MKLIDGKFIISYPSKRYDDKTTILWTEKEEFFEEFITRREAKKRVAELLKDGYQKNYINVERIIYIDIGE